ncbi:MAG: hypothetical protein H7338_21165 [Candidatus Sericytochromatia bacterium]|nr:hypothetical protein [Candidatus Sericytochromatia bacterium]
MKLRIKGNSIRLRLTRGEVDRFRETGQVADAIAFGPGPEQRMTYVLATAEVPHVQAGFAGRTISVWVPPELGRAWATSEQVGFEGEQSVGNGDTLRLLIEKDFHCLAPRDGEDDSDAYANPLATT